jgi:DNA-binding MarR family transcriptional regulator
VVICELMRILSLLEIKLLESEESTGTLVRMQNETDHVDETLADWRREWPELDTAPAQVVARLGRAVAYLQPELDNLFREFGLSRASFDVLATLRRAGEPFRLSQRALMDSLMRTSGTISVRIDRLEQAGLVERAPDPEDARGVLVALTKEGRELVERVAPAHLANEDRLLAALSPEERDALAQLLRKLLLGFESSPAPRRLGIAVTPPRIARKLRRAVGLPDRPGVLVRGVADGSPADRAGLGEGDLIVAADDSEVRSIRDLQHLLRGRPTGSLVVTVVRGSEERKVTVPGDG